MKIKIGDQVVELADEQAQALVDAGKAELVTEDETAMKEEKPTREQELTDKYGKDAEIAAMVQAVAGVPQALDALPEQMAKTFDEFLKKHEKPNVDGLAELKRFAYVQAQGQDYKPRRPSDPIVPMGTWTLEQAGLFIQALACRRFGTALPAAAQEDELVMGALNGAVTQGIVEGTGSSGGFLVPEDHQIDIIKKKEKLQKVWPKLDVQMTDRDVVRRPVESSFSDANVGTSAANELANVTETTITYAEQTWTMYPLDAYYPVSMEMLNDTPANIYAEVADVAGRIFARQQEKLPLMGLGADSEQMIGIVHDPDITHTSVGAALTVEKFLDVYTLIPDQYRVSGACVAFLPTKLRVDFVMDLVKNIRAGNLDWLGLPEIIEGDYLAEGSFVVGDLSMYRVYQNPGLRMITEQKARNKSIDIVYWMRMDGHATVKDAFQVGTGVTYT